MSVVREPQTLEEAFRAFHRDNPQVYAELRRLALDLVDRGQHRIGIGMLFEVLRWQEAMRTGGDQGFKLNNNFRAPFARMLMERDARLRGVFEIRHSRVDAAHRDAAFDEAGQGLLV